ncbi:hypothetical protein V8D89_009026 [Ganoderma adspersum]
MSARVTRKRSYAKENEDSLPPAKREPGQDDSEGVAWALPSSRQVDEQARGEQVFKDEEFWFEDDEEQTISCPVVHVSDSPMDLRYLHRVCFSKRLGRLYNELELSYHEVSAAIRLGDKYKITQLYSQSMEYLKHYFPSNFDSWLELSLYGAPAWDKIESIGAINLGRMTGELSILPAAFLACICMDIHRDQGIGHGITLNGGSKEHLLPNDLTACFDGKSSLRTATATMTLRAFKPIVLAQCKTPAACKKALRGMLLNFEYNIDVLLNGNPFPGCKIFLDSAAVEVCLACMTMVEERSRKEHEDVWNRLPELFSVKVPGWGKPEEPPRADVT